MNVRMKRALTCMGYATVTIAVVGIFAAGLAAFCKWTMDVLPEPYSAWVYFGTFFAVLVLAFGCFAYFQNDSDTAEYLN